MAGTPAAAGVDHVVLVLCGPTPEEPNLKGLGFSVDANMVREEVEWREGVEGWWVETKWCVRHCVLWYRQTVRLTDR